MAWVSSGGRCKREGYKRKSVGQHARHCQEQEQRKVEDMIVLNINVRFINLRSDKNKGKDHRRCDRGRNTE